MATFRDGIEVSVDHEVINNHGTVWFNLRIVVQVGSNVVCVPEPPKRLESVDDF